MRFLVSYIRSVKNLEVDEDLPVTDLGSLPDYVTFRGPLKVTVQVALADPDIFVSGRISAEILLVCDRCLEKYEQKMNVSFEETFDATQDTVDLNPEIRDAVFLELPVKSVCKEDCLGLCLSCGENRNRTTCSCPQGETGSKGSTLGQYKFK